MRNVRSWLFLFVASLLVIVGSGWAALPASAAETVNAYSI